MQDNLARTLPSRVPQKTGSKPKKRRKTAAVAKQKFRWGLAFRAVIYFALIMTVVLRYAAINELDQQIALAKKEFERIESQNIAKRVEIQRSINLEEIERRATEELGMVKPGENQIVSIHVQQEDSAQMLAKPKNDENVFRRGFMFIKSIVSYLQ